MTRAPEVRLRARARSQFRPSASCRRECRSSAEITSPTIWASTQTRISGVSPCSASSSALRLASSARSSSWLRRGGCSGGRGFRSWRCAAAPAAWACGSGSPSSLRAHLADARDQIAFLLPARRQIRSGALRRRLSVVRPSPRAARRDRRPVPLRAPARAVCTAQVVDLARARLRWPAESCSGPAPDARRPYPAR